MRLPLASGRFAWLRAMAVLMIVSVAGAGGISAFAARSTIVLGGTGVLEQSAPRLTACEEADRATAPATWATSGWDLDAGVPVPYSDRAPVDVPDPSLRLDVTGLRQYTPRAAAVADHPVVHAQYGISALREFDLTGDRMWLQRALRQGEPLVEMRTTRDDAWWFSYPFSWSYATRTPNPPWWSAMAQGRALSLFVRLGEATGERRWSVAAERTWRSFGQERSKTDPWSTLVDGRDLYLEEYAGNAKPLLVLNGQIFALFGVYDYWRVTADPGAKNVFDGAATTVLAMVPKIRKPGDVSYYCVDGEFCATAGWQNQKYHVIHSWQLDTLAHLTRDKRFSSWAQLLRDDWAPLARRGVPDPPLDADPLDPDGWEGLP